MLEGKVALVTGSARGTGAGIARAFAREGASVVVNQVRDEGDPEKVLQEILRAGGKATLIRADIAREEEVRGLVRRAEEAFGQVDILVHNYAAPIPRKAFSESTWEDWQRQIDYTLKAAFLCSQALLPGMKARRWGRIISVSTIGVHRPLPTYHGYTAAKAALLGFTRNLAVEVGPYHITVNTVSPGLTLTEEVRAMLTPEAQEKHEKRLPLRRTGTVEDTARVALFLASELGSFITGLDIPVCGGEVLK